MVLHMKTTLNISKVSMRRLKEEAARKETTMSELVESALRLLFKTYREKIKLPPLPEFESGGARVDPANREALYDVMEQD